jgi:hypothetical protein
MANVLTDLAGDIYKAADVVSRELVGAIPSITINGDGTQRAALNDTVRSFVAPAATSVINTPSMTIPEGTDQTIGNKTMTLSKSKGVQIPWTGEDVRHVNNGSGYQSILGDQFEQAFRTITNEMEADVCTDLYQNASRAYGTAGTTPFATAGDYTDMSETLRILKDNGQASGDNTLILNTAAGAKMIGKQADANRQGSDSILRQGVLLDVAGNRIRESAQVAAHTKGTGTGYLVNDASLSAGDVVIAADTGSGTILAGDVVTFAADANNKYVVTEALSGGSFTIGAPGLRVAIADNNAITVGDNYAGNILVARSAAEIAVRAPAMPEGGDAASDSMIVVDPRSGIPFDISFYKGFQKAMINVSAVWGYKTWKQEGVANLLG